MLHQFVLETQLIVCFRWFHLRSCLLCACVLAALLDFPGGSRIVSPFPVRMSFICYHVSEESLVDPLSEDGLGELALMYCSSEVELLVRLALSGPSQRVAGLVGSVVSSRLYAPQLFLILGQSTVEKRGERERREKERKREREKERKREREKERKREKRKEKREKRRRR